MDEKFIEVRDNFKRLLMMGVPQIFIELYFGLTTYAYSKYMLNLRRQGFQDDVTPMSKGILSIIKLFVGFPCRSFNLPPSVYDALDKEKLKEVTFELLQTDKIDEILLTVTPHIQRMREYSFSDDVPASYRDFINNLNYYGEEENNRVELFKNYAYDLTRDPNISFDALKKEDIPTAIAKEILRGLGRSIVTDVKPKFERDVCEKLHRMFKETLTEREKLILESYFGLGQEKVSAKDISLMVSVSPARVIQIKEKAVRRCRHTSRKQFLFDPLPIVPKPEKIEHVSNPEGGPHLVVDSNLSVRILNVLLYGLEVTTLEELRNFTRKDILKYKGLSKKSLCSIEDELMKYDLALKDEFSI